MESIRGKILQGSYRHRDYKPKYGDRAKIIQPKEYRFTWFDRLILNKRFSKCLTIAIIVTITLIVALIANKIFG